MSLSRCQARASGRANNRNVSAVGAQSTTTRSHGPDSTWAPQLEQRDDLVGAGELGQLVGHHRVDTQPLEHGQEIVLHRPPGTPDAVSSTELQGGQAGLDLDHRVGVVRRGHQVNTQRVTERVRRIGRHDQGLDALTGSLHGGCRGCRRLADAALAGEENDPHEIPELRLRPRRASSAPSAPCR